MGALLRSLVVLVVFARIASADTTALLRGLDSDDPGALSQGIAAIEHAPTSPELADVLFAAGRACEDRLYDPARALALYDRILRELPDAGVAISAARRVEMLRSARAHAREAAELAQLLAMADMLPPAEVERRAMALASASWEGAGDAALFLADWLCRARRFGEAQARYTQLATSEATRHAAGCAIEAKDWDRAAALADALATGNEADEAIRTDLASSIRTGRRREWLYAASWIALLVAGLALLASFIEAIVRGGVRRPRGAPPVEVMYIGPVGVVVVLAALFIDTLIAPAVIRISVAGLAAAWVSGATLDLVRARGRSVRLRSIVHVLACAAIVLAVGYIAVTRDGLLDMLSETVRFGPGA